MPNSPFRVNSPRLAPIILSFFVFLTNQFARAQSWSIPDAAGNINNTNTGNVGVGTSTPGFKFDVNGWIHSNGTLLMEPLNGNASAWFRGDASHSSNVIMQGGGGGWVAFWLTATTYMMKIGGSGGAEPGVGAINIDYLGNIGIGTTNPGSNKMAVEGTLAARKVMVTATNPFPDYVFDQGYRLPTLDSVAEYIRAHHHLPGIPSADSVQRNGLDVGSNQAALLQKIEELTLYIIQQKKTIEDMNMRVKAMEARLPQ